MRKPISIFDIRWLLVAVLAKIVIVSAMALPLWRNRA